MRSWIIIALILAVTITVLMIPPRDTNVTVTASGYVVDTPNVEGQIYIENPDGSTTIVLGDE